MSGTGTNRFAFGIITTLFFLWGFTTVNNDILIPYYKEQFNLNDTESMLVNLAFFGSYGIWSLVYFLYSITKGDPINRLGYKNGVIIGLLVSATASFSYYPLTYTHNYYICLIPLFLLGMGFTLLQISCNPYVSILGPKETASSRLNLSQGFNSLGTTIGPMILGYLILSYLSGDTAVQVPYAILGCIFLVWAIVLWKLKLPDYRTDYRENIKGSALQFRHLKLGMIAIFFYVGAEVAIGSKLIEYLQLKDVGGLDKIAASCLVGIYWGGAMIGRLSAAVISNIELKLSKRILYGAIISLASFLFVLLAVTIAMGISERGIALRANELKDTFHLIWPILIFMAVQFITMLVFRDSSRKMLLSFSLIAISLLIIAQLSNGSVALWSIVAMGLFNSIMWSNIFTLAIEDLREYTSQGSSLLIIMIVGGAVLPMIMGQVSDHTTLKTAYLVPIFSYLYIAFYGAFGTLRPNQQTYE